MQKMLLKISLTVFLCFIFLHKSYSQDFEDRGFVLKDIVNSLMSDSLKDRKMGSDGEKKAAIFLFDKLKSIGVTMLTPNTGDDFKYVLPNGDTVSSANIVGIIEGNDAKLKNEYVVVAAHYDNLGRSVLKRDGVDVEQVFVGADANSSGVAVLLDVAKQIDQEKFTLKRSVIFALFGGGEYSSAGSWYFLNRSFKDTSNIVAMINLDMVGRSNGDSQLYYYLADGNIKIAKLIDEISQMPLSLSPKQIPIDIEQSDHRNFFAKDIPIILFTTGMHRDYRTIRDTPDKLDYDLMTRVADFAAATAMNFANLNEKIKTVASQKKIDVGISENIYSQREVDKRATFLKGGEKFFLENWVYQYIKYPDSAISLGEEGIVTVDFIVEKNGEVSNVIVKKGVSDDIDNEAVRVISASPKWKAAQIKGEAVRVKISLPVEFRLTKKGKFKIKR